MQLVTHFEMMELDGETIAVPVGDGVAGFSGVLKLNEEAAKILKLLDNDVTEERIVMELLKEYSIAEEELVPLVHNFVEQLKSNNLIVE